MKKKRLLHLNMGQQHTVDSWKDTVLFQRHNLKTTLNFEKDIAGFHCKSRPCTFRVTH